MQYWNCVFCSLQEKKKKKANLINTVIFLWLASRLVLKACKSQHEILSLLGGRDTAVEVVEKDKFACRVSVIWWGWRQTCLQVSPWAVQLNLMTNFHALLLSATELSVLNHLFLFSLSFLFIVLVFYWYIVMAREGERTENANKSIFALDRFPYEFYEINKEIINPLVIFQLYGQTSDTFACAFSITHFSKKVSSAAPFWTLPGQHILQKIPNKIR